METAIALQEAGCFAVVLECVPAPVAAATTSALQIPTIGIGAGPFCSGQVQFSLSIYQDKYFVHFSLCEKNYHVMTKDVLFYCVTPNIGFTNAETCIFLGLRILEN